MRAILTADGADLLRLTILGGYLGSGKTTWARHQLHAGAFGADVHVIVNEAAEAPVDDALLTRARGMTLLAGGCCCCTGQAALIAALRGLADQRSRAGQGARLARVLLETSGLADPGAIVQAIQADPVLVNHIRIEETLVAVDALHALAQLGTEPLGRRQIAAADRLILTKTDAADPLALARLRATLARLNPAAPVTAAVLGEDRPLPPLDAATEPAPLPPIAEDARGPITPTQIEVPRDLDWSAFALWLSALLHARGDDLVRVKGVLRTPAGRLLIQTVRKVVQSPEILPENGSQSGDTRADDVVVFIGRGYNPPDLARSLRRFLT